jgi:hypothetical protein
MNSKFGKSSKNNPFSDDMVLAISQPVRELIMSLGLIKPGMAALYHPKTGKSIVPLYVRADGTAVWPVLGAASDDPDDPAFQDGGADDDEDEDDEDDSDDDDSDEDDDKGKGKKKVVKKTTKNDEDDEDDEDDKPTRPERQAARYRVKLREAEKREKALADRLQALEDKDKKPEELTERETREAKAKADKLEARQARLTRENAFLKINVIEWIDADDALALAERENLFEDVVDEDGTVDQRALRVALKDLAKRKPHLVKKPKLSSDDDEDDKGQGSNRSAGTMNGRRRGQNGTAKTREELAKKFPVLGR